MCALPGRVRWSRDQDSDWIPDLVIGGMRLMLLPPQEQGQPPTPAVEWRWWVASSMTEAIIRQGLGRVGAPGCEFLSGGPPEQTPEEFWAANESAGAQVFLPGIPGDLDGDGDGDNDDNENWPGGYAVRCDYNLDGVLDELDQSFTVANTGRTLGRGALSHSTVANRRGYSGGEHDGVIDTLCHVRHRVLLTKLGRWSRRDPLPYVDGLNLYLYALSTPHVLLDRLGSQACEDYNSGGVRPRPCSGAGVFMRADDGDGIGPCFNKRIVVGFDGASQSSSGSRSIRNIIYSHNVFSPNDNYIIYFDHHDSETILTAAQSLVGFIRARFGCQCAGRTPVVMAIGWSLGGSSIISLSNVLGASNIRTTLGFSLDPVSLAGSLERPIQNNRWINFWQNDDPGGWIAHGRPVLGADVNQQIFHYDAEGHRRMPRDPYVLGVWTLEGAPDPELDPYWNGDPREPVLGGSNPPASPWNLKDEVDRLPMVQ